MDLLRKLWKNALVIAAAVVAGALVLFAYSLVFDKALYRSSATLHVKLTRSGTYQLTEGVTTELAYFMNLPDLQNQAIDPLRLDAARKEAISISKPISSILTITVDSIDASRSRWMANKLVQLAIDRASSLNTPIKVEVLASPSEGVLLSAARAKKALAGALLGLVASICYVLLRYYLKDTVKNAAEITELLGMPVFARIRRFSSKGSDAQLKQAQLELNRELEALGVLLRGKPGSPATAALMSAADGDGKTTVATLLAEHLAGEGSRVLLLDLNATTPALAAKYQLETAHTLEEVLDGSVGMADAVMPVPECENLQVALVSGTQAVFQPDVLAGFLSRLDGYDYILADTSALDTHPTAALLAGAFGSVVFVVRPGQTRPERARTALALLEASGAKPVGAVANALE